MTSRPVASTLSPASLALLARASTAPAATTFAQFAGTTLRASEPSVRHADVPLAPGAWSVGVFFDMNGWFSGPIGILLSTATCDSVRAVLKDAMHREPEPEGVDSMLLELGNVVASQTVSAIADGLAGRIVLSIPHLVVEGAERELAWRVQRSRTASSSARPSRIEIEFLEPGGSLCALVVLAPDMAASSAQSSEPFDTVE